MAKVEHKPRPFPSTDFIAISGALAALRCQVVILPIRDRSWRCDMPAVTVSSVPIPSRLTLIATAEVSD